MGNTPLSQEAIRWLRPAIGLGVSNTDDWAGLQLDSVVFGGEASIPSRLDVSGAPYRFTPEKVAFHQDFSAALPQENIQEGAQFIGQAPGALTISLPAGSDPEKTMLRFPTRPIDETNYYGIRYRFTGSNDNLWDPWASFHIKLVNVAEEKKDTFDISFGNFRQSGTYGANFGLNMSMAQYPFGQNVASNFWHTLELTITPPDGQSDVYHGYFWADEALLGERDLGGDPARVLGPAAPLILNVNLISNGNRQVPLAVEIDDLVAGSLVAGEGSR